MKPRFKILSSSREGSLEQALATWFAKNPNRNLKNTILKFSNGDNLFAVLLAWNE